MLSGRLQTREASDREASDREVQLEIFQIREVRIMPLRTLRYFLTAAEEMNFRRAAERLYITQQSLSAHIQRLERQYDVILFERKPRLMLPPRGRAWSSTPGVRCTQRRS